MRIKKRLLQDKRLVRAATGDSTTSCPPDTTHIVNENIGTGILTTITTTTYTPCCCCCCENVTVSQFFTPFENSSGSISQSSDENSGAVGGDNACCNQPDALNISIDTQSDCCIDNFSLPLVKIGTNTWYGNNEGTHIKRCANTIEITVVCHADTGKWDFSLTCGDGSATATATTPISCSPLNVFFVTTYSATSGCCAELGSSFLNATLTE